MPYQQCPKCGGKGKIPTEVKTSRDTVGEVEKECDLCDGVGYLYEDVTPLVVQELQEIKKILKEIREAKK